MEITTILERKYPGQEWSLVGTEYDGLTWHSNSKKPTKATLEKLWVDVQAEILAEKQALEDARQSAIAKLEALGLTVDEVQAAFGIGA